MLPNLSALAIGVHYQSLNRAVGLDKDGNLIRKRTRGDESRVQLSGCGNVCVICLEDLSKPSTVPSTTEEDEATTEAMWNNTEKSPTARLEVDVFRDTCGHGFHTNCALIWLTDALAERPPNKNPPCPYCRASVSTADVAALKGARSKKLFDYLVKAAKARREEREREELREMEAMQETLSEQEASDERRVEDWARNTAFNFDEDDDAHRHVDEHSIQLKTDVVAWLRGGPARCAALERRGGVPITDWDTSNVTDMRGMFDGASRFNETLKWDTSKVTDMRGMFFGTSAFNNGGEPLEWVTTNVKRMDMMFCMATVFNQELVGWDTRNVEDMSGMFMWANAFNNGGKPLEWNTRNVTTMEDMFSGAETLNQTLAFDTRNVTNMSGMFHNATVFNNGGKRLAWDTRKVTDMSRMFYAAVSFNQPLEWDTRRVTAMSEMFYDAETFNQPLEWDTRNVDNMLKVFNGAVDFAIWPAWDTRSVVDFDPEYEESMFASSRGGLIKDTDSIRAAVATSDRRRRYWNGGYDNVREEVAMEWEGHRVHLHAAEAAEELLVARGGGRGAEWWAEQDALRIAVDTAYISYAYEEAAAAERAAEADEIANERAADEERAAAEERELRAAFAEYEAARRLRAA